MIYTHLGRGTANILLSLLTVAIVAVIALSLTYTFFTVPADDDFCRASLPSYSGYWLNHVVQVYHDWSGRFAVHTLYPLLFPLIEIHTRIYNVIMLCSPAVWLAIFYLAIRIAWNRDLPRTTAAAGAVVLCVVFWAGMPDTGDMWYWLTGLTEYELPFFLFIVCLFLLTSRAALAGSGLNRVGAGAVASVLAILVAGLHEWVGLLLMGVIGVALLVAFARRRLDVAALYLVVLVAAAAGVAVNVLAPGTVGHAAAYPHAGHFLRSAVLLIYKVDTSPLNWLLDQRLLFLSIILLTSPWFARSLPAWTEWRLWGVRMAIVTPILALLAVLAGYAVVVFGTGEPPPPRVLDLLYAIFILGWLLTMMTTARAFRPTLERHVEAMRGLAVAAALLFPLSLLFAPNSSRAVLGLRQVSQIWAPAIEQRNQSLRSAARSDTRSAVVQPINRVTDLFRWTELETDPSGWRNACFARYFGLEQVSVAPAMSPRPRPTAAPQ